MQHRLVISNLENINLVEGNNDKEHVFTETLKLSIFEPWARMGTVHGASTIIPNGLICSNEQRRM